MMGSAGGADAPGVAPALLAKAQTQGTVLVIVTLRVAAGATPDTVAAAKAALLSEIAATRHRVVRELGGLPQIALEASETTLRRLGASALVERIDESIPQPPLR